MANLFPDHADLYHTGIVLHDLERAKAELSGQLGIAWGRPGRVGTTGRARQRSGEAQARLRLQRAPAPYGAGPGHSRNAVAGPAAGERPPPRVLVRRRPSHVRGAGPRAACHSLRETLFGQDLAMD